MKTIFVIASIILVALAACSRNADDFDNRVTKAEAAIGLGNYLSAYNEYSSLAKDYADDPRRAGLLLKIADLQATGLGNIERAIEDLGRVIEANPLSEAARLAREKRSAFNERRGDYEDAIADYSALIKHFATKERSQLYRVQVAGVYLSMRDFRQSRTELKPLFKDKELPKEVLEKAIFIAAESYFLEGKSRRASGYYRWLLEEFPESSLAPEAKLHLATCYEEMGYLGVAGSITKGAAEEYPNPGVIDARMESLAARGKVSEKPLEGVEGLSSPDVKINDSKMRKRVPEGKKSLQSEAAPLASPRSQ